MKARITIVGLLAVAAVALVVLAACTSGASEEDLDALQAQVDALGVAPSVATVERFIEVTGIEIKGGTSTDSLAAPDVDPSTLSDGFGYKAPGVYDEENPTKWQVASYMWTPGNMTAFQGDKINLHFFIINGDEHTTWVEGPDGSTVVDETEMNRGREYTLTFDATQAGVYRLICNEHEPTMTAEIVVLPQ
jgi:plastocyanin